MPIEYQGHLPDGNPVQQHSAGEFYPCVLFQRGLDTDTRYYILFDGVDYCVGKDQAFQIQTAKQVMQVQTLVDPRDSLSTKAQKIEVTRNKRHQLLLEASDVAANGIQGVLQAEPVAIDPAHGVYTVREGVTSSSTDKGAREFLECLQKICAESLKGNAVAICFVSVQHWKNIARSLQNLGFEVRYRPRSVYVMEFLVRWE